MTQTPVGNDESPSAKSIEHPHLQNNQNKPIKFIDLFCGIGSFHYSFSQLGMECVMASDNYSAAQENYQTNYGIKPLGNICQIDPCKLEKYDILCAGFPCQPFSQAGFHKGFQDERGTMFDELMRFVIHNDPRVVVLENVPALLKHDNGKTLTTIKNKLHQEGYRVIYQILKCSDFGIPQMRKRLFIIGFKNISVTNIETFFNLQQYESTTTLSQYLGKNFEKDIAYTIRCGGKHSPINGRHNWDGYWVNGKEYRLTISDALKLQGFHNFQLSGSNKDQWKLLGNTIPTNLTHLIGKQILKHCQFTNKRKLSSKPCV